MKDVMVEYPLDWIVTQIEQSLLATMFSTYHRVRLQKEFSEGQSGTRVFLVQVERSDQISELLQVVKLGPAALIRQEYMAAQTHVLRQLPGFLTIDGTPTFANTSRDEYGGLRYALAGDGLFQTQALRTYTHTASTHDLWFVLNERLFKQLHQLWQANLVRGTGSFRASYDRILPVNWLIQCLPQINGVQGLDNIKVLNAETLQQADAQLPMLRKGDQVQLDRFIVTEIDRNAAILTLNLPDDTQPPATSLRLRLQNVGPHIVIQVGGLMPTILGKVMATRSDLLTEAIQMSVDANLVLTKMQLSLPGTSAVRLPNPLLSLPDLLERTSPMRLATIHGDLNMGNVLIDPQVRTVHMIDGAQARRDHVLLDLLRLETEMLLHPLAAVLFQHQLGVEMIHHFYQYAHCASQRESHPTGEFAIPQALPSVLEPCWISLMSIRNTARNYLAMSGDWQEYYVGLALCLLGALKFKSLDKAPVGRQPKAIAFWGAATIVWLLEQNEPNCQEIRWKSLDVTGKHKTLPSLEGATSLGTLSAQHHTRLASTEDREFLRSLLTQHQRNLQRLLKQKAMYGAGEEPLRLLNQIAAEEEQITELERKLPD